MNVPNISIIIPVYNEEKYLHECMDSLLKQTYENFEIICVDDGSTDMSLQILEKYARLDTRIRILTQQNQYAGVARNNGLKIARGKYVMFLDADDYFPADMLGKLIKKAEEDVAEIVVFDFIFFDNATGARVKRSWNGLRQEFAWKGVTSAKEIADVIYEFTTPAPFNKFFLKKYISDNHFCFQELQRTNDLLFVYEALSCAQRITILNEELAFYRTNNSMSLQGSLEKSSTDFARALLALKDFLIEKKLWFDFQKSYEKMALSVCVYNLSNMKSVEAYQFVFGELQKVIFPKIGIELQGVDSQVVQAIKSHAPVIVYGGGMLAGTVVRYLLYQCGYTPDDIQIVVTNLMDVQAQIQGIMIREFSNIWNQNRERLVLIAAAEKKVQDEIESQLYEQGFQRSVKIGYSQMAALISNADR